MKQFTKLIKRPDNISEDNWNAELINIALDIQGGLAIHQGKGIFSAAFVDLFNWTIVYTIIQLEHANQADVLFVHKTLNEFTIKMSKL